MKNKFLLPLLAVVFAVAGALATPMLSQSGWYDPDGTGPIPASSGTITTPAGDTPLCGSSGNRICKVGVFDAYSSAAAATMQDQTQLLKYTQP